MKYTVTFLLVLLIVTKGQPQGFTNPRFQPYSFVSLGAGTSTYFGDLAVYKRPYRSLTTLPRWNVGGGYTRQVTRRFSVRGQFTWVQIMGDDYTYAKTNPSLLATQFARNLHFRNNIKELSVSGIYQFVPNGRRADQRVAFSPYVFLGVAVMAHNPQAQTPTATNDNNAGFAPRTWVSLQPLHTEGQGLAGNSKPYALVVMSFPVGFGLRYRLNEDVDLGFEVGYRYTTSDYLDDVASNYATSGSLQGVGALLSDRRFEVDAARANVSRSAIVQQIAQADPSAFSTTRRGETGKLKDSYLLTNFSIHYMLSGRIKCP